MDKQGVGRSDQASFIIDAPLAALLSSPLTLLMPSLVGVSTVTAEMYCMSRMDESLEEGYDTRGVVTFFINVPTAVDTSVVIVANEGWVFVA
ncbi:hypothetical protein J1N35_025345 [Gossypium stocksii]|uniref:Uncharacterized protein n=1 Tax=Gossypium stocksii TaxID=47602 RepID=A0A9D3V647_9ROSI|nr:hypothetical protein J1N35_025345 [Gossypium stocksii]